MLEPEEPRLRRLTEAQYVNSVRDLLGSEVFVPLGLEPDDRLRGFLNVGASSASVSPRGVERFEQAAYILAEQAMEPGLREALLPCDPFSVGEADCAEAFLRSFGRRAWRRPLSESELSSLLGIAAESTTVLGDFYDGLEFAVAALLQSPNFLYRVELGGADPDGVWPARFDDWELASRLSFLVWNTTPDDALLDAAEAGELSTEEGLAQQVDRLLDSPRVRAGMSAWFTDQMQLSDLDSLYKDPLVVLHMSDTLGVSAREETLRFFEHHAFDEEGDLRDLLVSRTTFLNREMAALYEVQAPDREGFGQVELPVDSPRRGLLGQASFLALHSHPVSTSPTLRGLFVREVLLCQPMEPPLADIDTSIPPVTEEARTLRERVTRHLNDGGCAGCHEKMDYIGLGLENFDGIGRHRVTDNGGTIDASGELDGIAFADPQQLALTLRNHEALAPCLVTSFVRYANGYGEEAGQEAALAWLNDEADMDGYRLRSLIRSYVTSPLFLQSGPLDPVGTEPVLQPEAREDGLW
ncbi:MAG: DUF1592 domain-containing protein [Myxococcota bacterium]|nr:DUF1592 domain-containing protein [Myxococcota bacterium]